MRDRDSQPAQAFSRDRPVAAGRARHPPRTQTRRTIGAVANPASARGTRATKKSHSRRARRVVPTRACVSYAAHQRTRLKFLHKLRPTIVVLSRTFHRLRRYATRPGGDGKARRQQNELATMDKRSGWQRWLRQPQLLRWRAFVVQLHLWTGLAVGLYIVLLSVTGSLSVLRP